MIDSKVANDITLWDLWDVSSTLNWRQGNIADGFMVLRASVWWSW
jgi:hypothetical protein